MLRSLAKPGSVIDIKNKQSLFRNLLLQLASIEFVTIVLPAESDDDDQQAVYVAASPIKPNKRVVHLTKKVFPLMNISEFISALHILKIVFPVNCSFA